MPKTQIRGRRGFTIVELIIVSLIIVILVMIAMVRYGAVIEKSRAAEAYSVLYDIASSERGYYLEYNTYTSTWANLDRYSATAPGSENFSFSDALNYLGSKYVKATHSKGTVDYYVCIQTGAKSTSVPSCP